MSSNVMPIESETTFSKCPRIYV